jgi:tRNA-splicing ligase RtcB (3'-phosphate/5'-hydroxy nucleic acid ligase)
MKDKASQRKDASKSTQSTTQTITRSFEQELDYLKKTSDTRYEISQGFVPNMRVPAVVLVNASLEKVLLEELEVACSCQHGGGFLPALKQVANVAGLPGIVGHSWAMPDVHSGYGFV